MFKTPAYKEEPNAATAEPAGPSRTDRVPAPIAPSPENRSPEQDGFPNPINNIRTIRQHEYRHHMMYNLVHPALWRETGCVPH